MHMFFGKNGKNAFYRKIEFNWIEENLKFALEKMMKHGEDSFDVKYKKVTTIMTAMNDVNEEKNTNNTFHL